MGGLTRRRARGILALGGLAILVPFLHLGGASDRSVSVQRDVPARPVLARQELAKRPAGPVVPAAAVAASPAELPAGGLHLVVAD